MLHVSTPLDPTSVGVLSPWCRRNQPGLAEQSQWGTDAQVFLGLLPLQFTGTSLSQSLLETQREENEVEVGRGWEGGGL